MLTPAGRAEADVRFCLVGRPGHEHVQSAYERFGPLNRTLLAICTDWQVRAGGVPNDHRDPVYDWGVIDRLVALDEQIGPVVRSLGKRVARFVPYRERMRAARRRVEDGESDWLLSPRIDSYHTVWMQLHEDLLLGLGHPARRRTRRWCWVMSQTRQTADRRARPGTGSGRARALGRLRRHVGPHRGLGAGRARRAPTHAELAAAPARARARRQHRELGAGRRALRRRARHHRHRDRPPRLRPHPLRVRLTDVRHARQAARRVPRSARPGRRRRQLDGRRARHRARRRPAPSSFPGSCS